jgi:hypothetical protein
MVLLNWATCSHNGVHNTRVAIAVHAGTCFIQIMTEIVDAFGNLDNTRHYCTLLHPLSG